MPPASSSPSPPSNYDFILNHNQAPKRSIIPGAGSSKKQRIIFLAIGAAVLLILTVLLVNLLSGGKSKTQTLLQIAQTQEELIRVSTLASTKASSLQARSLAITTQLSMESSQKDIIAQLKKQGQKTNAKILGVAKNSKTDATLATAATDNRYDEAFSQIMLSSLSDYQKLLKAAFSETSGQQLRLTLTNDYAAAGLLIDSSKSS